MNDRMLQPREGQQRNRRTALQFTAIAPVFAGAVMALSSVSVVTNALRLNRVR
jgi:hypothetical protein